MSRCSASFTASPAASLSMTPPPPSVAVPSRVAPSKTWTMSVCASAPVTAPDFRNLGVTTLVHVVLHYEQIVNVSAAGAEVLD